MEKIAEKTSTWLALRNPVFRRLWSAMVVSGSCIGAHNTAALAGLQMDISGIIGPLLSALLLPLAGVSFIFGANGLGFLLMFLAILLWKRVKVQSSLPLAPSLAALSLFRGHAPSIPRNA